MANVILTGIIKKINACEVKGSFEKRVFHLGEEKDKYASVWSLEAHQGFCSALNNYNEGDKVECHVEIVGREWNDKAFNTLKCFRINALQKAEPTKSHAPVQYPSNITEPVDDLPF